MAARELANEVVTVRFTVRDAGWVADREGGSETLVISELPNGQGGRSLGFGRLLENDDADRDAGIDTYAVFNEKGNVAYGAIAAWQHAGEELILELRPDAARRFGADQFQITIATTKEKQALISRGLALILGPGLA